MKLRERWSRTLAAMPPVITVLAMVAGALIVIGFVFVVKGCSEQFQWSHAD